MAIEFFNIRESDTDLLYQLAEVEQSLHPGKGMSLFETFSFIRYGRVYAAVDGDEILAAIYFLRDFENTSKSYMYGVTVVPEYKGKRLAESLMLSAFADLKDSGIRMVEVTVNPSSQKAIATYTESLGFNIINLADGQSLEEQDFLVLRKNV